MFFSGELLDDESTAKLSADNTSVVTFSNDVNRVIIEHI